jgi:hypothetical protein
MLFAGAELSAGRKPVTFVGLDENLNVSILEKWDTDETISCLQNYEHPTLTISTPPTKHGEAVYAALKGKLVRMGWKPFPARGQPRQWMETAPQDCFRALSAGHKLLPQRALEGRLQRAAILFELGVQITDPVDMFEEFTRYKLMQGILPLENLPSSRELDALAAAYLAWLAMNRPGQIVQSGGLVLPAPE